MCACVNVPMINFLSRYLTDPSIITGLNIVNKFFNKFKMVMSDFSKNRPEYVISCFNDFYINVHAISTVKSSSM